MATSWYCVDEDGHVGIFDIDDNGPVPVGEYRENCVDEVFYEDFTFEDAQFKRLHLSSDQIFQMLEPMDMEDVWEEIGFDNEQINSSWREIIVQIDMDKFDIFKKAHELDADSCYSLVCQKNRVCSMLISFITKLGSICLNRTVLSKQNSKLHTLTIRMKMIKRNKKGFKKKTKGSLFTYIGKITGRGITLL
ncbi:MAG: hypothetical protein PUK67_09930 [Prevotellaceae bacterium]|nr:hypothetical protein [Prevotellaceae bacterium]MDY3366034.1 hypothetical protein [Prevotella sp.]